MIYKAVCNPSACAQIIMGKKLSLRILWKRLCLKTPSFFRRVKIIGGTLGATALLVRSTYSEFIPEYLNKYLEYCIVAGAISILIAQFSVENPEDLHKDEKN